MKQENFIFLKGPPGRNKEIYLSKEQLKQFKLSPFETIELQFGIKRMDVLVMHRQRHEDNKLYCSHDVLDTLQLPEALTVHVHYNDSKGRLRIGPVVGILAHVRYKPNTGVYGEQEGAFRQLLQEAAGLGLIGYVFSPLEIEWARDLTWAYQYISTSEGTGHWEKLKLPLPDVIYDQISTRKYEKQAQVQDATKRLKKLMQNRFFNQGFFNKWQVHQWLTQDASTSKYVPDTICYESPANAAMFLNRYGTVYLKPIHGSLGIGIIKLSRLPDGRIYFQLKQREKTVQGYAKGAAQALQSLKRGKNYHLIVQQGLNLLTYKGRPFDIRVLMQKDKVGKWARSKMFARIAKQGEITSNLTTGGDARLVNETLLEIMKDQRKVNQILKDIRTSIKIIPAVIEEQAEVNLGELGLDLGIDIHGRIWVIEVNAKPWKKTETEHGTQEIVERSFRRPMEYARYLALL